MLKSKYNLKQIAQKNKYRIKKSQPIKSNDLIEAEYYSFLRAISLFLQKKYINFALEEMRPDIEKIQDESYSAKLDRIIKQINKDTDDRFNEKDIQHIVKKIIFKTDKYQHTKFKKASEYGFGFDISKMPDFQMYRQFINSTIQKNISQVKYLREETKRRLEISLRTAIEQGKSITQIRNEILEAGQITKARAAIIARNEIKNLTSALNERRAVNAGFEVYEWLTADDQRVRGNPRGLYPKSKTNHWIMNGLYCKFDNDKVYSDDKGKTWKRRTSKMPKGKPGQEINCRCDMVPIP
jgi:uncharacterized protein with gpF-like domain